MPVRSPDAALVERRAFAAALLAGLSRAAKSIPSRFFYDARGSALFEKITALPEYYITRTEIGILRRNARAIAAFARGNAPLVEFGSGSSRKTEILLRALRDDAHRDTGGSSPASGPAPVYVPIDVSPAALDAAAARLRLLFPSLVIRPVAADFRSLRTIGADLAGASPLGFFPGSTIGNFLPEDAALLLASMARLLGPDGRLVIGIDLAKAPRTILAAYDDSAGITAEFNRNLLVRANGELGANFDVAQFRHAVTYDEPAGRLDMWLTSLVPQEVRILGRDFSFGRQERIHTEFSHKYEVESFSSLAASAGWRIVCTWTDPARHFAALGLARE